jgi:hypothetical protein
MTNQLEELEESALRNMIGLMKLGMERNEKFAKLSTDSNSIDTHLYLYNEYAQCYDEALEIYKKICGKEFKEQY